MRPRKQLRHHQDGTPVPLQVVVPDELDPVQAPDRQVLESRPAVGDQMYAELNGTRLTSNPPWQVTVSMP